MAIFHQIYKCASVGQILSLTLGTVLLLSSCSSSQRTPVDESEGPISVITGKPSKDGIKLVDLTKKTNLTVTAFQSMRYCGVRH